MPQDQLTGARANFWGRETARKIMTRLHAEPVDANSNECVLSGKHVVIKCAHFGTSSIGVSYLMAERVDSVIAAFEISSGMFSVYELPIAICVANMRETRSLGPSRGRVGIVKKKVFLEEGATRGVVVIPDRESEEISILNRSKKKAEEPLSCPTCDAKGLVAVVENYRSKSGIVVEDLSHLKCKFCGERLFDNAAMHRIETMR